MTCCYKSVTMASRSEVAVFTKVSMGTHIAMSVSPQTTIANFKRELERCHFQSFPELGKITATGIMVKRKNAFYHLPGSLPIKFAFQGLKGAWFLHVEATPNVLDKHCSSQFLATEKDYHTSNSGNVSEPVVKDSRVVDGKIHKSSKKKKRERMKNLNCGPDDTQKECMKGTRKDAEFAAKEGITIGVPQIQDKPAVSSSPMVANPTQMSQEVAFTREDRDCSNFDTTKSPPRTPDPLVSTCPKPGMLKNKSRRIQVGKRIVRAADMISRSSGKKQSPAISCYRLRHSTRDAALSVFEIGDD